MGYPHGLAPRKLQTGVCLLRRVPSWARRIGVVVRGRARPVRPHCGPSTTTSTVVRWFPVGASGGAEPACAPWAAGGRHRPGVWGSILEVQVPSSSRPPSTTTSSWKWNSMVGRFSRTHSCGWPFTAVQQGGESRTDPKDGGAAQRTAMAGSRTMSLSRKTDGVLLRVHGQTANHCSAVRG